MLYGCTACNGVHLVCPDFPEERFLSGSVFNLYSHVLVSFGKDTNYSTFIHNQHRSDASVCHQPDSPVYCFFCSDCVAAVIRFRTNQICYICNVPIPPMLDSKESSISALQNIDIDNSIAKK